MLTSLAVGVAMNTLLVEDDLSLRQVLAATLEAAGHSVVCCGDIDSAERALLCSKFDILILDLFLGDANSLGLASLAGYTAPEADILVLTGSDLFPRGEIYRQCPNVSWILRKPVSMHDLTSVISHVARRGSLRHQVA